MPLDADEIIQFNITVGGIGHFKINQEVPFRHFVAANSEVTVVSVCYVAYRIVIGQYFTDGNHRTGLMCIYLKLIDDENIASRRRAYQTYAYLDDAFSRYQKGEQDNLQQLTDFIGVGGFFKFRGSMALKPNYRNEKIDEILALDTTIKSIVKEAIDVPGGEPWTKEKRAQLRAANEQYRQLKGKRAAFKEYNGG